MHQIRADQTTAAAIVAVTNLLGALRLDHAWVGSVALSAWLGAPVSEPVDVLATTTPERSGQIPMMASNRGFRVERAEVEATEELDLVPLNWVGTDREVRVHVLMASNALYGRMLPRAVEASVADTVVKVAHPEDLGLLLMIGGEADLLGRLIAASGERFDRERFNQKLVSIGLGKMVG